MTNESSAVAALRELVALKELKERLATMNESQLDEFRQLNEEYARRKPLAWAAARAALSAAPAVPEWLPTTVNVNALPEPIRRYIHDIETKCDPAGDVREITMLRDQVRELAASNRMLRDSAAPVSPPEQVAMLDPNSDDAQGLAAPPGWWKGFKRAEEMYAQPLIDALARAEAAEAALAVQPLPLLDQSADSLGAPASPSGSTLQPPAAASAAIPGAESAPGERAMVLLDLAMLELACLTGGDVADEDYLRGRRTIERIVDFFKANPRPYHFAPEAKPRRPEDDEAFDAEDQDAP